MLRFLTLLLAIVMMTSAVVQASGAATPGAAPLVIEAPDAPDLDPLVLPESGPPAPIAVAAEVVTPASPRVIAGRRHAVLVFRPPRLFASR